jgi:hypothetical protein
MRVWVRALAVALFLVAIAASANAAPTKYRWKKGAITISVSTSLTTNTSNIAAGADAGAAVDRSLAAWQQAGNVSFRRVATSEQNISPAGAQGDGISLITIAATPENLAMFPQGFDDATARTRVFYDARGFITEADVVLNPYLQFSTDGTPGTFDLESTVTHELGHVLGLGHSPVFGATMSEGHGRNGVYNLPAFAARTLAADDIASLRSLYGPADNNEDCCGRVSGKLTLTNGKPAANFTVWAENSDDGRVLAAVTTAVDGTFRIGGLDTGKVEIYAQNDVDDPAATSAVDIGQFAVSVKQPLNIVKRLDGIPSEIKPEYLGFNGQLAGLSVMINPGNVYDILIGIPDLKKSGVVIGSSSDLINTQRRPSVANFGNGISTLDFYATVSPDAPNGDYSLFVQTASGARRYLIGGLTVEKFPNLWSAAAFR